MSVGVAGDRTPPSHGLASRHLPLLPKYPIADASTIFQFSFPLCCCCCLALKRTRIKLWFYEKVIRFK
ncbi:hypothetical protein V6N12_044478 [Hibiscus sabdariffa]|uniref:Uncharacterized protein n=1 Tax=Hibiscus sabdariffa TaxID=183260 RepID=A0ABR2BN51_9ROSI